MVVDSGVYAAIASVFLTIATAGNCTLTICSTWLP